MGKAWPALEIHVPGCDPSLVNLVIAELDDFQPTAIHESEDAGPFRVFFTTADACDAAARALGVAFGSYVYVKRIEVDDGDWAARSQAQLKAITIGRIVVAPPWDAEALERLERGREGFSQLRSENPSRPRFPRNPSRPLSIVIQPSMGFGTGHHATTRLVLRALQELPLEDRTVLDIGCGSGLLAIAAIKLGARSAIAVDIDPDALENARENVDLNDVGDRVQCEEADFREMSAEAGVVVANLTGTLLERSAEQVADLVAPGGYLVVSGFMNSETDVAPALERFLTLLKVDAEEEWLCAVLKTP